MWNDASYGASCEGIRKGPNRRGARTGPRGPQKNPHDCRAPGKIARIQIECKNCFQQCHERARGLCRDCYKNPVIREKFPKQQAGNRRGTGTAYFESGGVRLVCRHCQKSKVNRPRGLCWGCYYTPGVKDLYPSTSKYARRGVPNKVGKVPLADSPTTHAPGTEGKLACMEARAKAMQAIFHPGDARFEGDDLPETWMAEHGATFVSEGGVAA